MGTKKNRKTAGHLWASRFGRETSALLLEFSESLSFDRRLAFYDIKGSLSHTAMLKKIGVLSPAEASKISGGLKSIRSDIEKEKFVFKKQLEDVHMNIESELIGRIGPVGGKVHTGRSRNDQIALDTKMYVKDEILNLAGLIRGLLKVLLDKAEENIRIIIPAYTHLQQAQPVSAGHYFTAYACQFERDLRNMFDAFKRADVLPLGVGAVAGVNYPTDRKFLAKELGFSAITENSMDTVSDRDYQAFLLFACSLCQTHLSRLSEDLIVWNSSEFGYVEIDDAFTTGSSIMPNKKNPDILELIRGKTGRVTADLMNLLINLKGLPMSYNRDLQEDKPALFDAIDTTKACLSLMAETLKNTRLNAKNISRSLDKNFILATDLADYLVAKGVPFREAHGSAGRLVRYCQEKGKTFSVLSLAEFKAVDSRFGNDIRDSLDYEKSVNRKISPGGTSFASVRGLIRKLRKSAG